MKKTAIIILILIAGLFANTEQKNQSKDTNKVMPKLYQFSYKFSSDTALLTRNNLEQYKSLSQFLATQNFFYLRSLRQLGQPDELLMNGSGFGEVTYLLNGFSLNERTSNSFDLNNIQTDNIESIEIIPAYKAFLYGNNNNPSAINFIERNFVPQKPISRIRFIQASNEEASIEGTFRTFLLKNTIWTFNFTSESSQNYLMQSKSSHSNWRVNTNLYYILSENQNLNFNYKYVKNTSGLSGGLDANTFINYYPDYDVYKYLLYGPARYSWGFFGDRHKTYEENNFRLNYEWKLLSLVENKLTAYYAEQSDKINQTNPNTFSNNFLADISGLQYQTKFTTEYFNVKIDAGAENQRFYLAYDTTDNTFHRNNTNLHATGELNLEFSKELTLSGFAKLSRDHEKNYYGSGANINYFNSGVIIDAGLSYFSYNPLSNQAMPLAEKILTNSISTKYNTPKVFVFGSSVGYAKNDYTLKFNAYYRKTTDYPYFSLTSYSTINSNVAFSQSDREDLGIGITCNAKLYNFHCDNKTDYTRVKLNSEIRKFIPEITHYTSLYYADSAYSNKFKYKLGFEGSFLSKTDYVFYDYASRYTYFESTKNYQTYFLKSDPKFVLNGYANLTISKVFTVFLNFENILGYNYTVLPNYPVTGITYKLGIVWELEN